MTWLVRLSLAVTLAAPPLAWCQSLGEKVFEQSCRSCHDTGRKDNDAPQLSHVADWKERAKSGREVLYRNAIDGLSGYFVMPPRGGDANLSDAEVKAAVDYILRRAGVP